MGMTIDESGQLLSQYQKLFNSLNGNYKLSQVQISELSHSISTALETMRKYQKMQANYVNRLKADMVAMLTEIQLEIEELDLKDFVYDYQKGADETREYIADLLQQKIDTLLEVCGVGSSQDWNGTH